MRVPAPTPALALAAAVLAPLPAPLPAQRTPVRVVFEIADAGYADIFTPDELARVERDAAALVAGSLAESLPVLDLAGTDSARHRLVVTLDLKGGSEANPLGADRGFYVHLESPEERTDSTWWSRFQTSSEVTGGLGGRPGMSVERAFLDLVQIAVDGGDVDALVRDHLSRVPIVQEGRIWPPPPDTFRGWVATRGRDDLCLALDSDLRVIVLVPSEFATGTRPREYEARVEDDFEPNVVFGADPPPSFDFARGFVLRPEPADQAGLDRLSTPEARVVGFYLVRYEPDRTLCAPLPTPAEAEQVAGGGP